MNIFKIFILLVLFGLSACHQEAVAPATTRVAESQEAMTSAKKENINIMSPEQAATELQAQVEEKENEFILLYKDKNEKMYIEGNRLIRNINKPKADITSFLTLESLTSLRSMIFSEGFYQLPRKEVEDKQKKGIGYLKIQSNKRFNNIQFVGKASSKNQPVVANIVKELHRLSDAFRAPEPK